MKILLLTFLITAVSADKDCRGLYIGNNYYDIQIVKEGINKIKELVFNGNDNTAYFTFEQTFSDTVIPSIRNLGYVRFNGTGTADVLVGVRNATGLAMDQYHNILYVGGSDGLFMFDMNNKDKVAERLTIVDDIKSLFFKNNVLYIVNTRRQAYLYMFESGIIKPVYELQGMLVDKLIIDDDNNIHYLQENKVFRVKIGTKTSITEDELFGNDIAVDFNYKAYVCAKEGLFAYNKYTRILDKVADLKNLKKLAFTLDNTPIYVVADILVRLINNPVPCIEKK